MRWIILLPVALGCVLCLSSCSTTPRESGKSDLVLIHDTLRIWREGVENHDIDKIMSVYSDKFHHDEAGDKAGMRAAWIDAYTQGQLDRRAFGLNEMNISIEGTKATVDGVRLDTSAGTADVQLDLEQEQGAWRIVGNDFVPL